MGLDMNSRNFKRPLPVIQPLTDKYEYARFIVICRKAGGFSEREIYKISAFIFHLSLIRLSEMMFCHQILIPTRYWFSSLYVNSKLIVTKRKFKKSTQMYIWKLHFLFFNQPFRNAILHRDCMKVFMKGCKRPWLMKG